MKHLYAIFGCAALMASANVMAQQQIANSDFEGEWADCIPYTYYGSEGYTDVRSQVVVGQNPANWIISNVAGMAATDGDEVMGMGATEVGAKTEGVDGGAAVLLTNTPNPFMAAQIVPAYLTLGTSWSTAAPTMDFSNGFQIVINNSDGGTFGGQEFTERPKGIEFMYKRGRGEAKPQEKSTVVAYLWKGHWTQHDVPVTVYMAGEPTVVDMVDRDRCILGYDMTGCQGGEIEHTDDAELIAVINAEITNLSDEWVKFSADFDYKSDATPEMINIVIAAGDYFGGADVVGDGNNLTVDNFKLIYDEATDADLYPGKLNIEMMGGMIAENMDSEIQISYTSNSNCTLSLPNFALDLGEGPVVLGDIVVPNVAVTPGEGKSALYSGSVKGLSLLGGGIVADANVEGTIDAEGNANFYIAVLWNDVPINVTFAGAGKPAPDMSGIASAVADSDAPAAYYTIGGIKADARSLTPGLYIKVQGNKATKVIIK